MKSDTPGQAIKRKCLECLNAPTGRSAFDCEDRLCPLFSTRPFRDGKTSRSCPTRGIIRKMCWMCNPTKTEDCTAGPEGEGFGDFPAGCPLWEFRPWARTKRRMSPKQAENAKRLVRAQSQRRAEAPRTCHLAPK